MMQVLHLHPKVQDNLVFLFPKKQLFFIQSVCLLYCQYIVCQNCILEKCFMWKVSSPCCQALQLGGSQRCGRPCWLSVHRCQHIKRSQKPARQTACEQHLSAQQDYGRTVPQPLPQSAERDHNEHLRACACAHVSADIEHDTMSMHDVQTDGKNVAYHAL